MRWEVSEKKKVGSGKRELDSWKYHEWSRKVRSRKWEVGSTITLPGYSLYIITYKLHITKTRLFKYTENFTSRNWKFSHFRRGGSNEYPQSMFLSKNKKTNIYPYKPQFYYIKGGQNYIGMFSWWINKDTLKFEDLISSDIRIPICSMTGSSAVIAVIV